MHTINIIYDVIVVIIISSSSINTIMKLEWTTVKWIRVMVVNTLYCLCQRTPTELNTIGKLKPII